MVGPCLNVRLIEGSQSRSAVTSRWFGADRAVRVRFGVRVDMYDRPRCPNTGQKTVHSRHTGNLMVRSVRGTSI